MNDIFLYIRYFRLEEVMSRKGLLKRQVATAVDADGENLIQPQKKKQKTM